MSVQLVDEELTFSLLKQNVFVLLAL